MSAPGTVTYEQPLNERIRSFLRLEFLFGQARYALAGHTAWDSRAALSGMFGILNVLSRADLKTEYIKELERQAGQLQRLRQNPGVDQPQLDGILRELEQLSNQLVAINGMIGGDLRNHELLNSIRQRDSIAGGTCDFDLPAYHYWLQQPADVRVASLEKWFAEFEPVRLSTKIILRLIRDSSLPTQEMAHNGFFQKTLGSNNACQLIRVTVPADLACYPEISGGKHRFSVRFVGGADPQERPVQSSDDIAFELTCCML